MNSKVSVIGLLCLSGLLSIILLSNGVVTAGDIENLVTNPDFDLGTNGWTLGCLADGAAGLITTEKVKPAVGGAQGDCLYAKIDGVGNDAHEPEIHSPAFDVKAGKVYTISLWAKTEAGKTRPLYVAFEQLDTWQGVGATINITDEWTEYHTSPVMNVSSPPQVVIHIHFSFLKEDVWFDHFRVYLGEYIPEDISPKQAIEPIGKLGTTWGDIKSK
jgi:hypothetical protein